MATSTPGSRATPSAPASERVRLARLALEAALGMDGVVEAHAGRLGLRVTADRGERLPGVVVTALAGGRYAVELHLVTEIVPLHRLAEGVRARVERAAATAGLAAALGPVSITVEEVVTPDEVVTET